MGLGSGSQTPKFSANSLTVHGNASLEINILIIYAVEAGKVWQNISRFCKL